ncbi:MAG TPA: GMC family oxidoreductase N-terminal domain-containing protein [bacterium]|nr:GMC family oxidoreductase N-terminal domain-containing protein [bacterium]
MESTAATPSYDYVIVGSGTAGCTLANRLSADPALRVLLLEAGGKDDWIWMKIPVGYLYCINNPRADWRFHTVNEAGLNGRSLLYPRGRTLGGSSSINAMIYMRGQKQDYDGWARAAGDDSWRWDDVLPIFKSVEDYHRGANEWHGAGGEWHVESQRLSWEILNAFQAAAGETGIPAIDDFNRGNNFGSGPFEVNQRRGVRLSASTAFLKPVLHRPNLTVLTGAQARRVLFQGTRATGVEFDQGGATRQAAASREVILAAGSIGSPQLLQLSGVGPRALLDSLGIPVVCAAEDVGGNLHDHLQLRLAFRVSNTRTLNEMTHSLFGKAKMGLEYLLFRRGPLTMAPSQMGAFAPSDPSRERPNLEFHVQPLSLDKFGDPLHTFPAFTVSVCNLQPTSRGYVRITTPDFRAPPEIHPNYLATEEDQRVAVDALRLGRRIVAADALKPYQPAEFVPGPELTSDADLVKAAGDVGTTIFHPVGTCRMGSDDGAVVDSRLRVRGVQGLRVVDASIMPTISSGNTAAPTLLISEKGSRMILEDRNAAG